MRKKTVYALYRGDELLGVGTANELADARGVKPRTIQWLASPTARKQGCKTMAYRVEGGAE